MALRRSWCCNARMKNDEGTSGIEEVPMTRFMDDLRRSVF